jgi:hypothetical protein
MYIKFLFVLAISIAVLIYFFIERKQNNMSTSADDTKIYSRKEKGLVKGLEREKISDKYYGVGYSPFIDKYVLYTVVTWVAWYNRYYEISEEEYESFDSQELDVLARKLYEQGNKNERFLFSEKKEENNEEQLKLLKKAHLHQ